MLPSDLVNPSFNALRERGNSAQVNFKERGESVFAVTYRKLKVKSRSNGEFKDKPLGPYRWKAYYPLRLKGKEPKDLVEVELELDEEPE